MQAGMRRLEWPQPTSRWGRFVSDTNPPAMNRVRRVNSSATKNKSCHFRQRNRSTRFSDRMCPDELLSNSLLVGFRRDVSVLIRVNAAFGS